MFCSDFLSSRESKDPAAPISRLANCRGKRTEQMAVTRKIHSSASERFGSRVERVRGGWERLGGQGTRVGAEVSIRGPGFSTGAVRRPQLWGADLLWALSRTSTPSLCVCGFQEEKSPLAPPRPPNTTGCGPCGSHTCARQLAALADRQQDEPRASLRFAAVFSPSSRQTGPSHRGGGGRGGGTASPGTALSARRDATRRVSGAHVARAASNEAVCCSPPRRVTGDGRQANANAAMASPVTASPVTLLPGMRGEGLMAN
ncbi:hypothetical protein AAFF_G00068130 [Aldrovandia affinis]|uniref:Uncharacterized protein n=1 Tax=Aldrovandia affinis TaxID=143900 RepID=A0AAD7RZF1_9TELE|nr:hypothetical protein AAFF_G00068130 [Aldrovandia affinis]